MKRVNDYQRGKADTIQMAQDFQQSFADGKSYYWSEFAEIQTRLERRAKRYGLLREFRENGII